MKFRVKKKKEKRETIVSDPFIRSIQRAISGTNSTKSCDAASISHVDRVNDKCVANI